MPTKFAAELYQGKEKLYFGAFKLYSVSKVRERTLNTHPKPLSLFPQQNNIVSDEKKSTTMFQLVYFDISFK